jgi:hypothetical protein
VDVILGRIDLLVAWEDVKTWHMEYGFLKCVALPTIVGANTDILLNIDTVAGAVTLTTCQHLERTRSVSIHTDTAGSTCLQIIE